MDSYYRMHLYVFWFFLTFVILFMIYKLVLPIINLLYLIVAVLAVIKDIYDESSRIKKSALPVWFRWFEHSGILAAFVVFAVIKGIWYDSLILLALVIMVLDIPFDVWQDIRAYQL